jgi:hypothetical protein
MIYLQDSKIKVQNAKKVSKVFQDLLLLEDKLTRKKSITMLCILIYAIE